MAYESRNYNAFPAYPVTGPAVGLPITTFEGRVIRALLTGINFTARLQVANVINRGTRNNVVFTPAETDWVDAATITSTSPQPVDLLGPARWVRLVLDSGTLVMATVEEDTRAAAGTDAIMDELENVKGLKTTFIDAALADIAQTQDTNDMLTQQAILAARQQAEATAERADTAMADALVMAGVNSAYLSYDGMALPAGAPENSIGAVWDNLGLVRRFKRTASAWVQLGSPVLTALGLRLRVGWNLRDYADLVVNGNWTPAMTQLLVDAQPGDAVLIPAGDYRFDGPIVQVKPLTVNGAAARFLINHTGVGWECKPVAGTFGLDKQADSSYLNLVNDIRFPAMLRQRSQAATTLEGSTGVKIWNSFYCQYSFNEISGFDIGLHQIAQKLVAGEYNAISYCKFYYTLLRNRINIVRQATLPASGNNPYDYGYISDNSEWGGSLGSYFTQPLAAAGQTPTALGSTGYMHTPVTDPSGQHYMNYAHDLNLGVDRIDMFQRVIWHKPTLENTHKFGSVMFDGAISRMEYREPRYEMPGAIQKIRWGALANANTITDTYGFGPGYAQTQLQDDGYYNRITLASQWGRLEYWGRHWQITQTDASRQLNAGELVEWSARDRRTPIATSSIVFSGAPITIDASKDRSWFIDVQADMPADSIVVTNPPTNRVSRAWLTIFQRTTSRNIHPRAITNSRGNLTISPQTSAREVVELEIENVAGTIIYGIKSITRIAGTTSLAMDGTAAPVSGTYNRGDYIRNTSAIYPGDPLGWVCTAGGTPGTWQAAGRLQPQDIALAGNNNTTHQVTTLQRALLYDVPLTANRSVRLYNATVAGTGTPLPTGAIVRVVRTAAATGAFTLSATDNAGAVLHEIPLGTWREYQFDGVAWRTIGSGNA